MASWLKVAEDLLEVVDRRAKLVVNELSDEQSGLKPPVSSGQELQAKRTKSTGKTISKILQVQLKSSSLDSHKLNDNSGDQISDKASGDDALPDTDKLVLSSENDGNMSSGNIDHTVKAAQMELGQVSTPSEVTIPDSVSNDMGEKDVSVKMEVPSIVNGLETASPVQVELTTKTTVDEQKEGLSSDSPATGVDTVDKERPADAGQDIRLENEDNSQKIDHAEPVVAGVETHGNSDGQADDAYTKEPSFASKKQHESKEEIPTEKVQDQLDEAQGLLKSTNSTGQSKEARLARVCAGLSSRLQEYKSENAQLEELLTTERGRSNAYETRIKQLLKDLSASKVEVSRVESHMSEALAAKNSEIDALVNSLDTLKKQATASEEKLTSLQENMDSLMRNRELSETRMMQALREELASVEHRAEEERAAHHATKKAAMEREVELEHRAVEAATALARMQRAVDERTSKVAELEQKVAFLETESATLNQELQDMETRARRGQMKLADEGNQALQMQAWQEEVDRARQGQREAEKNISSVEAEVQKMRVEIAGMKRDAEHYSRQEHMELEKRYRELTDLLYHKQTQLETMASEKAAAEFQLEKEVKRLQEAQAEAEKNRAHRRTSSSFWEEDNADLKSLEPLPLHHRHIAGGSLQLQKAVKLLDSGAVSATRFLWRYPVARVILMFYMVFVHLFLMYLLHRLQAQADKFAAREVAASMGLTPP